MINYRRYPLDRLDSIEAKKWINEVQKQLKKDGSCQFPKFIEAESLEIMAQQANSIAHLAYPGPSEVSPYFFNYQLGEDQDLPFDHPLKRKGKRKLAQVATDLIPERHLLSQLHRNVQMTQFLGAVIGQPVYRNADPYQSLNISVMDEGGCQQWHFDGGNMVTTLLLQEPENGGLFQYAPAIRSEEDEHFDEVKAVLDGNSNRVKEIKLDAGMLSLFRGHYSLHRVTEVIGKRKRLQAILGYNTQKGYIGKKESSILHYGPRVAENELSNPLYPIQST